MKTSAWITIGGILILIIVSIVMIYRSVYNKVDDEDNGIILDYKRLIIPKPEIEKKENEYRPDEDSEWIIDIESVHGDVFRKSELRKFFDYEWRTTVPSLFYGYAHEEKRWTYADGGGDTEIFTKLQLAIDLKEVFLESRSDYDPLILNQYLIELTKRFEKYPFKVKINPKESVASAASKAKRIIDVYKENLYDAIIVLNSNTYYLEDDVWNTLESLGLEWGDGDLFHWGNTSEYGDQQNFSVWSTTGWGYFFPKNIRTKELNPKNLVFGFSVPRSADPKNIYDIMVKSAIYCQQHLGGALQDRNGNPFNEEMEKADLLYRLEKMKSYGFIPGSGKMLRMY